MALSPRFKENFEQASAMQLDDLLAALDLLDVLEEAEQTARSKPPTKPKG